jgi:hypothetical protein
MQTQEPTRYSPAPFLGWQVAAFSAGAAAIHFAVISEHFEVYWVFGAFFLVVAWFQAASSIAVVAHPDRRLLLAIAVVNVVVIVIWIWSRTAGLPIGPEAGEPEAIGAPDVLSTVLEALLVVWAIAMLFPRISSKAASRGLGILTTAVIWVGVLGATALVLFTETGEAMPH